MNTGDITASSRTYSKSGYGYSGVDLTASAGGIVGEWNPPNNLNVASEGEIVDCTNNGSVKATATSSGVPVSDRASAAGGICGMAGYYVNGSSLVKIRPIQIERCKNGGTISASHSSSNASYGGGIVGACNGNIVYCRNSGSASYAISATYNNNVSFCYNTGTTENGLSKVTAKYSYDAGASSSSASSLYRVNSTTFSYFLKGTPSQTYTKSVSEQQMRMQSTYTGFDFETDWVFLPGPYPYPQLRSNLATPIKSICIAEQPNAPLECIEGYFPSYNGLKVGILFEDGTSVIADPWSECFSLLKLNSKNLQSIPLTVLDCETSENVNVIVRDKLVVSITVATPPAVTRYYKDADTINTAGALLAINYDDTSVETIEISPEMISGFVPGQIGTQTLTVTYDSHTCTFDVSVYGIASISVHTMPTKTDYVQGQPLNLNGGVLDLTYTDGLTDTIWLSAAELIYDQTATGTIIVTAVFEGKTTTFPVTINARNAVSITLLAEPQKLSYAPLENLDFTGSQLKVIFESADNYTEIIPLTEDMISGYDNTSPGYQTLTVQYCGKSTTYLIQVRNLVVNSTYSVSDNKGVSLSVDIDVSQQLHGTVLVCAYRDGRLVNVFSTTQTGDIFTFTFSNASATDSFALFVMDDKYCPLIEKQTLTLTEIQ